MRVYFASPGNQVQAEAVVGRSVLVSFGCAPSWIDRYIPTFDHVLLDSGAYSELNSGKKIDGEAYREWATRLVSHVDATAGLDDISGDWKRSLKNYADYGGFPTFHDTDPGELLDELLEISRQQGNRWIGLGLKPPRGGKEQWVRDACARIPDDFHVHGWALRAYTNVRRLDSVDSTNWWRDGMKLRVSPDTRHLTYGECLDIVMKRYERAARVITEATPSLFDEVI